MGSVEDIDRVIAGINQEIARLTNLTPPKDAGFLINANGILRGLRDDWELLIISGGQVKSGGPIVFGP